MIFKFSLVIYLCYSDIKKNFLVHSQIFFYLAPVKSLVVGTFSVENTILFSLKIFSNLFLLRNTFKVLLKLIYAWKGCVIYFKYFLHYLCHVLEITVSSNILLFLISVVYNTKRKCKIFPVEISVYRETSFNKIGFLRK